MAIPDAMVTASPDGTFRKTTRKCRCRHETTGMETPSHQEWRSRQHVSWRAIAGTTLIVGAILFLMSGGSPWSTAGTMNAIMGRDIPAGMVTLLFFHLLIAFLYAAVIAHVIYRLRLIAALFAGLATGLALYAVNAAIFHSLPLQMQSPEGRALFVHISFSLLAAAGYKAMSVPRPFRGETREVEARTTESIKDPATEEPQPQPVADRSR
jgi:hypothetical protein